MIAFETTYSINGQPYKVCDCNPMTETCKLGQKRILDTCEFRKCLVPIDVKVL